MCDGNGTRVRGSPGASDILEARQRKRRRSTRSSVQKIGLSLVTKSSREGYNRAFEHGCQRLSTHRPNELAVRSASATIRLGLITDVVRRDKTSASNVADHLTLKRRSKGARMKMWRLMKLSLTDGLLLHNKSTGTAGRRCATESDYRQTHLRNWTSEELPYTAHPSQALMSSRLYEELNYRCQTLYAQ